eukprot:m.48898 g.48898  ORF g.48898 m.48898 type:complete len:169 (+) comp17853_c0_seq1:430-936(+)
MRLKQTGARTSSVHTCIVEYTLCLFYFFLQEVLDTACDKSPGMKEFLTAYVERKIKNASIIPEITKHSDEIYLSGQLTENQFKEARDQYKLASVANLRNPAEAGQLGLGVLAREAEIIAGLGLKYLNTPITMSTTPENMADVKQQISELPKPVLVHCRARTRCEKLYA